MKIPASRLLRLAILFGALANVAAVAGAAAPCCGISGIEPGTGVVTARDNASNRMFRFQVRDPKLLHSLQAGQPVWANFTTKRVSLDGQTACCEIIAAPTTAAAATTVVVPNTALRGSKTIDPCAFASAEQIKLLLPAGLAGRFPFSVSKDGEHFKVDTPTITGATCPNLRISARAHVQFRETRGFPQFETGGTLEFTSPLSGRIEYHGAANAPVQASNFVSATACLTDIHITSLTIDRLPGWLDTTWLRQCFNGDHADWGCRDIVSSLCFDVSALVRLFLAGGNNL